MAKTRRAASVVIGLFLVSGCTHSGETDPATATANQSTHAAVYTDPNGRALAHVFDSLDQKMLWLGYSGAPVSAAAELTGGIWMVVADTDVPQPLALTGLMVQVDAKGAPGQQMTIETQYATGQATDVQSALDDVVKESAASTEPTGR